MPFCSDPSPDAFARVVDELLDSPHYGERWGRYWLDVARYADTRGYLAGGEERRFPFSYTYRDYVIRAFTEDKPYDQFLREQIAADRLVSGDDQSALAALGFLTLGRSGPRADMIDDRIDVITRGLMALTVTCARCHDHKFDPIPTADYYSLSGVFQSSQEPEEKPLLTTQIHDGPEYQEFLKKKAELEAKVAGKDRGSRRGLPRHRAPQAGRLPPRRARRREARRQVEARYLRRRAQAGDAHPAALDHFSGRSRRAAESRCSPPWFAFAALPEQDFAAAAKAVAAHAARAIRSLRPALRRRRSRFAERSRRALRSPLRASRGRLERRSRGESPAPAALAMPNPSASASSSTARKPLPICRARIRKAHPQGPEHQNRRAAQRARRAHLVAPRRAAPRHGAGR